MNQKTKSKIITITEALNNLFSSKHRCFRKKQTLYILVGFNDVIIILFNQLSVSKNIMSLIKDQGDRLVLDSLLQINLKNVLVFTTFGYITDIVVYLFCLAFSLYSIASCKISTIENQDFFIFKVELLWNFIISFTMKYKKQLRWLAFLMGPFIALLCLYVFVLLLIAGNSFKVLENVYNFQTAVAFKTAARALHLQGQQIIQTFCGYFQAELNFSANFQELAIATLTIENKSILEKQYIQGNSKILKNSFENSTTPQLASLYIKFINDSSAKYGITSQLQYFFYQKFLRIQNQQLIESYQVYFKNENNSFCFKQQSNGSYSISQQTDWPSDNNYHQTITQYQELGNHSVVVPLFTFDNSTNSTSLSFCRPYVHYKSSSVFCLKANRLFLGQQLAKKLPIIESSKAQYNISLLFTSKYLAANTALTVFDLWSQNVSTHYQLGEELQYLSLSSVLDMDPTNTDFRMTLQKQGSYSLSSIKSSFQQVSYSPLKLLTSVKQKQHKSTFGQIQYKLNTIIILTVILIFVEILIISYVIKTLLDSADKGLFQIQHMTKLIMNGDINIEIPSYEGTEDIMQVYDKAKILNKLHRYSTQTFFTGNFSEKILKYVQALQFIKFLNYDPGNLFQNLGEAYTYIEEWDQSLKYLQKSVANILQKIQKSFGPFDNIYKLKLNKQALPHRYRQKELVLIRRLFKLNFCYIKYLELGLTRLKVFEVQNPNNESFKKRLQQLVTEFAESTSLIKKAFYPNFEKFSECLIIMIYESKQRLNNNKIEEAKAIMKKTEEIFRVYEKSYANVGKQLELKRSKKKYLCSLNKMTCHSRTNPDLVHLMIVLYKAKIIYAAESSPRKYNTIFDLYKEAFRRSSITMDTAYILAIEIRKMLIQLKIDPLRYESTQIFKQFVPYRTFHKGAVTKQNEQSLLKKAGKECVGLEREFLFVFDCQRGRQKEKESLLSNLYSERVNHIFEKWIAGHDRLSIIKFNCKQGIKIQCNLTVKENNETLLNKALKQAVQQRSELNQFINLLSQAVFRSIWRVKDLAKEKIIILLFKNLEHYQQRNKQKRRFVKRKNSLPSHLEGMSALQIDDSLDSQFGDRLVLLLQTPDLRNTKVILYCGKDDNEEFIRHFGLKDINKRVWQSTGGVNSANNVVFIIEEKHRADIDRILMPKITDVPDNNIFIL